MEYPRDSDTEYKILNDIANRLGNNTEAKGKIKLFTELDTCDSCSRVIAGFAKKYKNIELEVIHNNGNRLKP
ncbi:deaminase domain-containing protein [Bacillus pseudomycoides]|uniref:deaminase domain-containing protein n=1 Tax=Bacillus pseudomycoides TaxID=64104 RepID=UPI0020D1F7DC|nr:deaminase domain-containing protein [Bacillus pseudomycoides]